MRKMTTVLILAMALFITLQSCRDPQSNNSTPDGDTVYVYLDHLLEANEYYTLASNGINGVDTLATMRLMEIRQDDTYPNGWELLIFACDPDSSVNNAQDIIITHAPGLGER